MVLTVLLFALILGCRSAKEVECSRCGGEGKVQKGDGNPGNPNPYLKTTCPKCKGKGKVKKS
jgi:DnaJ-class molecular chaperone